MLNIQIFKKTPFLQNIPLVLVSVHVQQAISNVTSFLQSFEFRNILPHNFLLHSRRLFIIPNTFYSSVPKLMISMQTFKNQNFGN